MSPLAVANTRPVDQAPALSALLCTAGFIPRECPAIEVIAAARVAEMQHLQATLGQTGFDYVVFPSRHAVLFFVQAFLAGGATEGDLRRLVPICGPGTASEVAEYPFADPSVLPQFSAAHALTFLTHLDALPERVLVPRAAEGRDELVAGLQMAGIQVIAPVVYRTTAVPPERLSPLVHALGHRELAALTFTSPSAVYAVGAALDFFACSRPCIAQQVAIVCLGPTTAEAASAACLPPAAVASTTSLPALVDAVAQALDSYSPSHPQAARHPGAGLEEHA